MREIARRLKISHSTVSRAMRDDPRVRQSVREVVERTAKEMGYRPDPMLGALALLQLPPRSAEKTYPHLSGIAWT